MYETLFKHRAVLARYRGEPYAEARERFVEDCAKQGYPHRTLAKIAWILMAVASGLDLGNGKVTRKDVEHAVDNRRHFVRRPEGATDAASSREVFIHFVTAWLRSMDLFTETVVTHRFGDQIGIFVAYMRDERGLSPVTISTRIERLVWFFDGLQAPRDSLARVTIADLDAFIAEKHDEGWSRASLGQLAGSLRSFFKFAEARGWCSRGLAAALRSPRLYMREGIPEGPAWEDVQRLLAATRDDSPAGIRDYAILLLLALYGFRRGEVAMLRLDDLDWEHETMWVSRPKRRCTQRYPFLPAVGDAILRYLREVRPRCGYRELFLALKSPLRPLSATSISAAVRGRLTALGIKSSTKGAHCLRHACAEHLLAAGFSLKQIGDHLGHRSANSTVAYTKIDINGLRQVAEIDLGRLL
jgi:site-specific recombinase XerD